MSDADESLRQEAEAYNEIDWNAVLSGPRVQTSRNGIRIVSDARQRVDDALERIEENRSNLLPANTARLAALLRNLNRDLRAPFDPRGPSNIDEVRKLSVDILQATESLVPKPKVLSDSAPSEIAPTAPDKLTVSWLFNHMPLPWWAALAAALLAAFTAGGTFVAKTTVGRELFGVGESVERVQAEVAPEPVIEDVQ